MRDIRFAGKSLLPLVRLVAKVIRGADEFNVFGFEITQQTDEAPENRIFIAVLDGMPFRPRMTGIA
jgi:hypothetical protein